MKLQQNQRKKKFNNIFWEEKNLKDVNRSFSLIAWEQWAIKDRWKVSMVPRWLCKWWWWWRRRWNGWFDVKQMSRGTFRGCKWGKDRWMEGWMIMMMMNYHGFGCDDDDDDDNRHSYKCFGNDWTVWLDVGSAALIALISVICHLVVSCYLNLLLWLNFTHFIHLSLEKVKILPQFGHLFIQLVNFSQYFDHMSSKSNWPLAGSVGANPRGRASCFSCHQKSHKTDKCSKLCRSIIENAPKYILHQIEAIWTQYLCITLLRID